MKRVLFVADSLRVGGLEKSLITLLKNFNYDEYAVELYLFNEGRDLLPQLPPQVKVLPQSPLFREYYLLPLGSSVKALCKKREYSLALRRVLRTVKPRLLRLLHIAYRPDTPADWRTKKKTLLRLNTHYDAAIGYAEGTANHYVADCVDADRKIGWIHTDVRYTSFNVRQERRMLNRLDYLVTVSNNSKRSILSYLPELAEKIRVLPNLLDREEIFTLAKETPEGMDMTQRCTKIVSVGRLVELKGFHLCPEVCRRLLDEGYPIHWYVVGEGEYRAEIEKAIKSNRVENSFTLLGERENPYCYEYHADICVQPSKYEGRSVVIEEMKLLRKPIVASRIDSFREALEDGKNALLTERTPEGLFLGLKRLLDAPETADAFRRENDRKKDVNRQVLAEIENLLDTERKN